MAQTVSTDMIVPEVFGDMVAAEFPNKIRFLPLAIEDTTLEGQPGEKLNLPEWVPLADATELLETDVIVPEKLTTSSDFLTIKEAGKGVEITDKAKLVGLGDPIGEARRQIVQTVANKIDSDAYATLAAAGSHTVAATFSITSANQAIGQFGEIDEPADEFAAYVISPADATALRDDPNFLTVDKVGDRATLLRGSVGTLFGVSVLVSNRAAAGALLVRRGALVIAYKRRPIVEADRDILARSDVITANVHYATYRVNRRGVCVIKPATP